MVGTFDKGELTIPYDEISELEHSEYDDKYYVILTSGLQTEVTEEEYNQIISYMESN